jgi:hypothetical protein
MRDNDDDLVDSGPIAFLTDFDFVPAARAKGSDRVDEALALTDEDEDDGNIVFDDVEFRILSSF